MDVRSNDITVKQLRAIRMPDSQLEDITVTVTVAAPGQAPIGYTIGHSAMMRPSLYVGIEASGGDRAGLETFLGQVANITGKVSEAPEDPEYRSSFDNWKYVSYLIPTLSRTDAARWIEMYDALGQVTNIRVLYKADYQLDLKDTGLPFGKTTILQR